MDQQQCQIKPYKRYKAQNMLPDASKGTEIEVYQQTHRQPHTYSKVNAYTHRPSIEQILTIVIFITQLALHCIFMIRPIFYINYPLLYFIWAIFLATLCLTIVDYFILTCGDPVDPLIDSPAEVEKWKVKEMEFDNKRARGDWGSERKQRSSSSEIKNPYEVKQCKPCKKAVKLKSYHCWACQRCVENMDHHCKYLNNCIGSRNYNPFFRLLSTVSLYFCCSIAIGIWVLVAGLNDPNVNSLAFSKWLGLAQAILSLLCLIVVSLLLGFHCYISCVLRMTTIEYIFRDTPSNNNSSEKIESASANRLEN